ncbi:hypothetical protein CBA19CS22_03715 [Caballeronia novacaledonica]|jgi:hypothetical protein|uniref:Uncharacterized protein n=1 Tax=Caballeronia novacaledonica TaxID=1544861 RepID=A0ACB5QLL9_9BURK|nr:hypothetical protein CBA19CS22_03715 [Caballeronia novacaledonica]
MMNFVLGFFREYWPVVVACAFARFGVPVVVDWLFRNFAKEAPQGGTERRSGVD